MARPPRLQLEGRTVLVTGAARGLGRHLALQLARGERADLVLVDRDQAGLARLADEITGSCAARVRTVVRDLLSENAPREVFEALEGVPVYGLINNAGMTYYGETSASELPRFRSIIDLDFRVPVELSLLFLSRFRRDGGGFILNVTSLAAFLPLPYQAVYAAAKAATQNFSDCLRAETRGCPVVIATFAPSGLATAMVADAGLTRHMEKHLSWYSPPQEAARVALAALKRGRRVIVPGVMNRILYALLQVVPRPVLLAAAKAIYRYERYRLPETALR